MLDLNAVTGLFEQEALSLLKQDGYNKLPSIETRNFLAIAWNSIQAPIFLLLIGSGVIFPKDKWRCGVLPLVFWVFSLRI
ncbi:cation-transporting P-type ATPase [Pseudanabaena sp. UWO310]|uniref:cation-transporting P-type ATPase n=1 Tax=Pseudanabaena sp. UWO310 TaxID=2480795 RepID=UPI0011602892|nr:hypothetical protein PseudUWO310_19400 [Pseudanabaena sp. UWO310]